MVGIRDWDVQDKSPLLLGGIGDLHPVEIGPLSGTDEQRDFVVLRSVYFLTTKHIMLNLFFRYFAKTTYACKKI